MNKILFNFILFILGITVTANMFVFPVQAEEASASDEQTVTENMHSIESFDDTGEETVIDNNSETTSEDQMIDEGIFSEVPEEKAGTEDTIEEEYIAEGSAEETIGGERKEIEEVQLEDPSAGTTEVSYDAPEDPSAGTTEVSYDAPEDPSAGTTEVSYDAPEDPSAGVTEMSFDDMEESSTGVTDMTPDDLEDFSELEVFTADSEVNEKLENVDLTTSPMVYERPVISSISTNGTSITLEWDNAEGALFQIYRWNILPYVIGTSTTGSFVDTNVAYGRSYTYFIATSSPAYRYPYSQTVSKRVLRPIEYIDEEHRIGEDLSWSPAEGEHGGKSLFISGSGSMPDFSSPSETPWHDNAGEIRHISIDDGVTYVGDNTFSDMDNLLEVSLPSSVREYGHDVFRGSTNLEFFKHDSAVDGDQLHIAVQYLTGIYSGNTFEPEVYVRKGTDGEDFDGMPELIRDIDYTVNYNNTTEVGEGTIEIRFIGNYADADSVVIPFIVLSELQKNEKIKSITGIELQPSSSIYTGSVQHPDMIVRSGRWILKEGVDYILTYSDMVDVGSYTVTAQGIGAYSGKVQAVYTILKQKQSLDPQKPMKPSAPAKSQIPQQSIEPSIPAKSHIPQQSIEPSVPAKSQIPQQSIKPLVPAKSQISDTIGLITQETVKESAEFNEEKTKTEEGESEYVSEPRKEEVTETVAKPEDEEIENATEPEKEHENFPSGFDSYLEGNLYGKEGFSLSNKVGEKDNEYIIFFAGAVGIVASICIGVYFWFFHWFLRGM